MVLHHRGFPIRKSAGQRLFPPHRGLSQVIASFFGSQCQGMHLTLFFAWTAVLILSILENKFQLFCLSFANNCFLGCKLKRPFGFIIHCCLSPISFHLYSTKLYNHLLIILPLLVRKNLYLNFFITSFSQYTTICFVSFVYSVFNEHFAHLELHSICHPAYAWCFYKN